MFKPRFCEIRTEWECKRIMVENLDTLLTDVPHIKGIGNIRNRTAITGVTSISELPTLQT